jgi:hypothetical protein
MKEKHRFNTDLSLSVDLPLPTIEEVILEDLFDEMVQPVEVPGSFAYQMWEEFINREENSAKAKKINNMQLK